jgi:hypothetical protein
VTEAEWQTCTNPNWMLDYIQAGASERKLRLYACADCRRLWHLLESRSRRLVEVAERFADGAATAAEREAAQAGAAAAVQESEGPARSAALAAAWADIPDARESVRVIAGPAGTASGDPKSVSRPARCGIVRDIFCNPFRPATVSPAWLTPSVLALAQAAYEERALPSGELDTARLAVLADALEDAGCDHADLLGHLRGPGPHVRGCWVIDLLLGKE